LKKDDESLIALAQHLRSGGHVNRAYLATLLETWVGERAKWQWKLEESKVCDHERKSYNSDIRG